MSFPLIGAEHDSSVESADIIRRSILRRS